MLTEIEKLSKEEFEKEYEKWKQILKVEVLGGYEIFSEYEYIVKKGDSNAATILKTYVDTHELYFRDIDLTKVNLTHELLHVLFRNLRENTRLILTKMLDEPNIKIIETIFSAEEERLIDKLAYILVGLDEKELKSNET